MTDTHDNPSPVEAQEQKKRAEFIAGLRELADVVENNPALKMPVGPSHNFYIVFTTDNPETARENLTEFARIAAPVRKDGSGMFYNLTRQFPGRIRLTAIAKHEHICERIITVIPVPEEVIPAQPERVIPAHEETHVSWKCPDSLFRGDTISNLEKLVAEVGQ